MKNIPQIIKGINIAQSFPVDFAVKNFTVKKSSWRNGMLVRMPNHLGDAVMALPALKALRSILPENHTLVVVCPESCCQLYESIPEIADTVIGIPRIHTCWDMETISQIRRLRLGIGVLFNNSFRDCLMLKASGIPELYGYNARCRRFLLKNSLPFKSVKKGKMALCHQANLYYALATAFGAAKWDGSVPELAASPSATKQEKILVISPGAAYGDAKRYPASYCRRIAELWIERSGKVIITGTANENICCDEIIKDLPPEKAVNLCGRTPELKDLMQVLKNADAVLANDSGTMHLAAALGCRGVTVFGPTDYTSTAPVSDKWKLIVSSVPCSPCRHRNCPQKSQYCMQEIMPETVFNLLETI